jgi:hypothetical protein
MPWSAGRDPGADRTARPPRVRRSPSSRPRQWVGEHRESGWNGRDECSGRGAGGGSRRPRSIWYERATDLAKYCRQFWHYEPTNLA